MARKGNPISVRLDLNRSSDSSWFSDYYYGKLVYQDVNLRSYFSSIRPPTILTFGFRLGRCIILHFPKRTFIHFFIPRRPLRLKRRDKSRPGKWWTFCKVGPMGCLEEEQNEVRGRGGVEFIRFDDRPKKMQRYGYHDQSPSRKKNFSQLLRVSGAFKHPKDDGVVNDIADNLLYPIGFSRYLIFMIENDDSFRKTKFFNFFFPKKYRSDGPLIFSREKMRNDQRTYFSPGRAKSPKSLREFRDNLDSLREPSESRSNLLKRTLPAVRPSLNYLVMQYFFNTKNKMHFDPVVVLNHFVAPGVAEPYTGLSLIFSIENTIENMRGGAKELDKRIRSRIAFFVESLTSEKKCFAQSASRTKRLIHFIRLANDLGTTKSSLTTISLFPFFGATFFFLRDGVGVSPSLTFSFEKVRSPSIPYGNGARSAQFPDRGIEHFVPGLNVVPLARTTASARERELSTSYLFLEYAREQLQGKFRIKCWNLMGQDKVRKLIEKLIDLGGIGEFINRIDMLIEILLRNRRIPYGYNSYLNEVQKMRSFLSKRLENPIGFYKMESVKIKSVYQSASLIAQDISFQLRNNQISFRSIFSQIVKDIPLIMPKGVEGIRICCSGRLGGAEIARTECGKYGKTSCNVFHQKIDYASAEVSTRYGILGVKVWISYSQKNQGRAISETYEI